MTKLIFLLLFLLNTNFYASPTIEKTRFYGVFVTSMPFWTFWNYEKVIDAIVAHSTVYNPADVRIMINSGIPVLCTWNYHEAEELKKELLQLNCELEIREIRFNCADAKRVQKKKKDIDS